jgi:hypothetical protein
LEFHPKFLKISMDVTSNRRHFSFRVTFSSSLDRSDQHLVQYVPLKITRIKELERLFWNTASFLFNHKAHKRAANPTNHWFLILAGNDLTQEPSKCAKLTGGLTPKVM